VLNTINIQDIIENMALKKFLLQTFTWWNGQTLGTWLYTCRKGKKVGEDSQGNQYYISNDNNDRRWVIYNGESEASKIPPEWHLWIHKTINELPSEDTIKRKSWEKDHQPNLTGSNAAYAPSSSLYRAGKVSRPHSTGDYEAWTPKDN
jgi:NADH:ubiquinone oxidoreductase subunit